MSEVIESFSGAHPYRPQCIISAITDECMLDGIDASSWAVERAAAITEAIHDGKCPRCRGPLDLGRIAGSRATECRCIPICPRCGEDECFQGVLGTGLSQTRCWPLRKSDVTKRRNKVEKMGTLKLATSTPDGKLLTDDGVTDVKMRPHPGGWAEFGYDNASDTTERQG